MNLIPHPIGRLLAALVLTVAMTGCAVAQQGQLTVNIKEAPRSVRLADKCDLLSNARMVAKCKACVTRKAAHVFRPFRKAGKRCEKAPAPQPAQMEPPPHLRNTRACEKHISEPRTQKRCVACVNRKKPHTYTWANPAGQRCNEIGPPPPPAAPRTLRNQAQCKAHVTDRRKKAKCVACTTRKKPHVFDPQSPAGQRCQPVAVAPPPTPVVVAAPRTLANKAQCKAHGGDRRQKAKCIACVTRKKAHAFTPSNVAGQRCQPVAPPPAPVVVAAPRTLANQAQCKAHGGDRRQKAKCIACVTRKKAHAFTPSNAAGQRCQPVAPPPAPTPVVVAAPRTLANQAQCKAQGGDRRQKAKCIACVTRKKAHVFMPSAAAGKRCQPAPRTPPVGGTVPAAPRTLNNKGQCKAQVADKRTSAKCVACVTRKKAHVFNPSAPAGQRCQPVGAASSAPVPPRSLVNTGQCKTQLHDARGAARCVACVTRDAAHHYYPEAAAGQRCKASAAPPAGLTTTADCKRRNRSARDKAKCVSCVTRKKPHHFFPTAPTGQRCKKR